MVINNNGETKSNLLQLKTNISKVIGSPESVVDICVLPKEIGNCDNSTERYYYDSKDNNCLVFVYSGFKKKEIWVEIEFSLNKLTI